MAKSRYSKLIGTDESAKYNVELSLNGAYQLYFYISII